MVKKHLYYQMLSWVGLELALGHSLMFIEEQMRSV